MANDADIDKAWYAVNRNTPLAPVLRQVYGVVYDRSGYAGMVQQMIRDDNCTQYVKPICRLYQAILSRKPDGAGLDYHTTNFYNSLQANGNNRAAALELVANQFINAPEYLAAYPPGTTNEQFITACCLNTLRRYPEEGAMPYWLGRLNNGETRAQIIISFSESQEFINATAAGITNMLTMASNWDPNTFNGNLF
jgi:hypothetical protein